MPLSVTHHANGRVQALTGAPGAHLTAYPPDQRTGLIEAALTEHRTARRNAAGFDVAVLDQNIDKLEAALEESQAEDRLRAERIAMRATQTQQAADATEARRVQADEAMKADTRATFLASNPTATAADFERLWPSIRDQQLVANRSAAIDEARASGRYSL